MAKYDGLIIPRSYNDYINKSDPQGVSQALQLTGVMDDTPTAGSSKPVKSSGLVGLSAVDVVETGNMHPVTSNAVAETVADLEPVNEVTLSNMHSVTSNAVANAINYPTTEQKTGGKFFNGSEWSDIYRKVVIIPALAAGAGLHEYNVGDLSIANLLSIKTNIARTTGDMFELPYYEGSYYIINFYNSVSGKLFINTSGDEANAVVVTTFEYTKLTN